MSRSLKIILVVVSVDFMLAPRMLPGRPFVTDDPEPVDYQHWEFYIASMHSELRGDWSGTAPHFEVN